MTHGPCVLPYWFCEFSGVLLLLTDNFQKTKLINQTFSILYTSYETSSYGCALWYKRVIAYGHSRRRSEEMNRYHLLTSFITGTSMLTSSTNPLLRSSRPFPHIALLPSSRVPSLVCPRRQYSALHPLQAKIDPSPVFRSRPRNTCHQGSCPLLNYVSNEYRVWNQERKMGTKSTMAGTINRPDAHLWQI